MSAASSSSNHTAHKVGAIPASMALLALAVVLATSLSQARSKEPLGARVRPGGWTASFRLPRRFQGEQFGEAPADLPHIAHGRTRSGHKAILAVYRMDAADFADPASVCDSVIRANSELDGTDPLPKPQVRSDRLIGSHPSVEIALPDMGVVARAMLLPSGEAYALWLGIVGAPMDDDTYSLFDKTCLSFERESGP